MQFMQPITRHTHFINGFSGCQISQDKFSLINMVRVNFAPVPSLIESC